MDRRRLQEQVTEASAPVARFWPMRTYVSRNPLQGLESLHFNEAVNHAKQLLGGNGYLSNDEYRRQYHQGRITPEGIVRALHRVLASVAAEPPVQVGSRRIEPSEVLRLHLLYGIEELEPSMLAWQISREQATTRFRGDVPQDTRQRVIERHLQEPPPAEQDSEGYYVGTLWTSILTTLNLTGLDSEHPARSQEVKPNDRSASAVLGDPDGTSTVLQETVGEWVANLAGVDVVEQINEQVIKWCAAFLDEGFAGWHMPSRQLGFYKAWRELAPRDYSGRFLGIRDFAQKIARLPEVPEDAIDLQLRRLGIPEDQWTRYLSRHLAHLPGWAGFIKWRVENPEYPGQQKYPINATEYLAVRLFYEGEFVQAICQRIWQTEGTLPAIRAYLQEHPEADQTGTGNHHGSVDLNTQRVCRQAWRLFHLAQFLELSPTEVQGLSEQNVQRLLDLLDRFPQDTHGPVWLEAYEDCYRQQLLGKLASQRATQSGSPSRPKAQAVFCIDVRSESFRRHIEAQGEYETFGFAGFFGVPISFRAFDSHDVLALCPVLIKPTHAVREIPQSDQDAPLQDYASGSRWHQLGHHLFHDLKANAIASYILIDLLGLLFGLALVGRTVIQVPYRGLKTWLHNWIVRPVATRIPIQKAPAPVAGSDGHASAQGEIERLAAGFTPTEQANFVEGGLRAMGLTRNFARLVLFCGHGSITDNNPYAAALDCGACGGSHGDPNARVLAAMANSAQVRAILQERGLSIPPDTWFLAGKHITTTDRVIFYHLEDVPSTHQPDLQELVRDLAQAGMHQALERCRRLPGSPARLSPETAYRYVARLSADWSQVRPEWGLSGNAAFIVGRRSLTRGINLGGRVFLHSYDPEQDPSGNVLEKIMTAPLIVGEWISMQYYFSGADPWVYGSGSKVIHNVVGGFGLMLGRQSDLMTGLPLQTVNNGPIHYHEPMRLLAVLEASTAVISPIIQRHTVLQHLFDHQWVNLVALDPVTGEFQRYRPQGEWEKLFPAMAEAV
ncbi:MAG: DUF2309 domain-containing protein [Nitrospiraceae bacterium]